MSFRVPGLPLRFDPSGNVDMDYDLKLWVWQDPTPKLRTVGSFTGHLQLKLAQMCWYTPRNTVGARLCVPSHMGGAGVGGAIPRPWVGAPSPVEPEP